MLNTDTKLRFHEIFSDIQRYLTFLLEHEQQPDYTFCDLPFVYTKCLLWVFRHFSSVELSCKIAQTPMHSIRPSIGNSMAEHAMDTLAMDFTLLEKPSDAFENVLVLTDIFTKLTLAIPTTNKN